MTILKPIILVDGSSYLYRAFHAMPALMNSKGFPTGAIYGMINMLRKLLSDYQPEQMAVIFDAKGKTFRDEIYEPYKANRPEMPVVLSQQIDMIHQIIKAMGLPILMIEGVEADDVIGTLAKEAAIQKKEVLISTGDKDLAQLVDSHITLVNTMSNTILNPETVVEKFGIPPNLIVDYLSLVGDPVDNVPGVPQVGPKTAVKWLQEYGSLENIMSHAHEITGKVGDNLRIALTILPLAKSLVTIKTDVKLNDDSCNLDLKKPDETILQSLFQELEFKNWLNELLEKNKETQQEKYQHYEIISSKALFEKWLNYLKKADQFTFDLETTDLSPINAEIVGISFAIKKGHAAYIPLAHEDNDFHQLPFDDVLKQLKPIFENPNIKKMGQHIKYDMEVMENYHIQVKGCVFDTMIESYILDSSSINHNLDTLALKYLGWRTISYKELTEKGSKKIPFYQVPIKSAATYANEDADVTLQVHQVLWPRLTKEPKLKYIFEEIEMPLVSVLARMEKNGVLVDVEKLKSQSIELEKRLFELEQEVIKLAGTVFNLNSPKQLQDILFNKLQLPILQKTPTGQPSTADSILQELALNYPLPKLIIEYRILSKLITTYTKKLPEQVNKKTGRIHTSYNQTGTTTGRLSSSNPNLQNIPARTYEGRRIRQAFIAPKGYKIICADYSQIELRIMAHLSGDKNLLKAFEKNLDIHTMTASEIFNVLPEEVTSDERRKAKAINFGLIYGMSSFGLSKQIGSSKEVAETYMDRYFSRYPGVMSYMENTRLSAKDLGYVETLWGRRLYVPDIHSSQIPRRKAAERAAINGPLQGSAADIIKKAMITIDEWLQTHSLDAKMIMQVHDELVFEVKENDVERMTKIIREHMMNPMSLQVPLLVSIGVGDDWDAASENA